MFGKLIGGLVKNLLPGGVIKTVAGAIVPKVLEHIAGDLPDSLVQGKPTYQEILHNEKIQDVIAPVLGSLARRALPDADEKAVGRLFKKIGDDIDG